MSIPEWIENHPRPWTLTEPDGMDATAEFLTEARGRRIAELEAELARIRPVYNAAVQAMNPIGTSYLAIIESSQELTVKLRQAIKVALADKPINEV